MGTLARYAFRIGAAAALFAGCGVFVCAAEPTEKPGSYNYYEKRGNTETMNANFDAAITDWQRAAKLDPESDKSCRGETQRVQIDAAKDAKAEMTSRNLTKAQAAAWYKHHVSTVWLTDKCNGP
jgi:hypothetical protein